MSDSVDSVDSESDYVIVSYTCGSIEEARRISRLLVAERLVACAQIIPWIESIYMWNSKLNTTQESLVFCKTRKTLCTRVKERILQETSYEIPEIVVQDIIEGHAAYLRWIDEATLAEHEATL